jgi:dienelactone hydrolase
MNQQSGRGGSAHAPGGHARRGRVPAGRAAWIAARVPAAAALVAAGGCAALTPNPMPRYARPRPAIVEARLDSVTREGTDLVQPVRLRAADGAVVDLLVKRPAPPPAAADGAPAPRPAPLVLILGGHQAGREAARLIPETRGYAIVAMSYPYQGDRRLSPVGLLRRAPAIRRAAFATPTAIQLALDWLLAQPWVDTARVEGMGASLGVPFMTVAAANDPRITRLWLVYGAGQHYRLLSHNTRPLIGAKPLRAVAKQAVFTYMAGRHFSPDVWVGRVAPRPVVMINALDDERLPRESILALYDSARAPKQLIWLPGKHIQRNRPDVVRALVATVLATMERTPLPEAAVPAGGAR